MTHSAPQVRTTWTVTRLDHGACQVRNAEGLHVGNLKWIGGQWKFKAIGYDEQGRLVPGGGPLTAQHNATFATGDAAEIQRALGSLGDPVPGGSR